MSSFNGKVAIDYLQQAAQIFAPIKQQSYTKMQIEAGDIVLDAGCGPGIDALALAEIVTSTGQVIGIDHDQEMLDQANRQAREMANDDYLHFQQADVCKLPFPDNHFDSCRSERLFMHLQQPEKALQEIARVTKPGGRVVIVDTDWGSLSIDNPTPETERILFQYRIDKIITNGYSGRSLHSLFRENHFFLEIEIEVFPLFTTDVNLFYALSVQEIVENQALADNVITEQQLADWRSHMQQAATTDTFYSSINIVMVSGTVA